MELSFIWPKIISLQVWGSAPFYNILCFSKQFHGRPLESSTFPSDTLPSPPHYPFRTKDSVDALFPNWQHVQTLWRGLSYIHSFIHSQGIY